MAEVNIGDAETFAFHVEIADILSLLIDMPYNNREIFLGNFIRISNEALDKIRIESFTDKSKLDSQPELFIRLIPDKTNNTLSIVDSGIGMTKSELVNNLGTSLETMGDESKVSKFGVVFCSAFLVAQKVIVTTKHNVDEQYSWESQAGDDSFTVTKDVNGEQLGRGNKITLVLKEDQLEYLDEMMIKDLVMKNSKFISYPIYLWTEASCKWELINEQKPISLRKPEETTKDEYASFFKSLAYEWEDYLAVKHLSVEGQPQFSAILFVPNRAPLLLETKKKSNIKLYVRRVFIMDNCEELIPEYLGFVKGVVDCDDLPLNISPDEMLQQNKNILQVIRESLVQKCFEMFYEIAERKQDYIQFYQAFSRKLELGIHEDNQYRAKLADLLRYHTTKSNEEPNTLKEYATRAKDVQKVRALSQYKTRLLIKEKGPQFQSVVEHAIDEYGWKEMVAATKDLKLEDKTEKRKKEAKRKSFKVLCKMMKDILGDRVEKVIVSDGSLDSPCGLVTCGEEEVKNHAGNKIMEINPDNYIIKELRELVEANRKKESTKELVLLLFETAILTSGFGIDEPKQFALRIHRIFKLLLEAYKEAKNARGYEDC